MFFIEVVQAAVKAAATENRVMLLEQGGKRLLRVQPWDDFYSVFKRYGNLLVAGEGEEWTDAPLKFYPTNRFYPTNSD